MQVENIFTPEELQAIQNTKSVLRAIDHPLRLKLLSLISHNGEMTVKEIYRELDIEQSLASLHLNILRNVQVVNAQRQGKNVRYSLNSWALEAIVEHCEMISHG